MISVVRGSEKKSVQAGSAEAVCPVKAHEALVLPALRNLISSHVLQYRICEITDSRFK